MVGMAGTIWAIISMSSKLGILRRAYGCLKSTWWTWGAHLKGRGFNFAMGNGPDVFRWSGKAGPQIVGLLNNGFDRFDFMQDLDLYSVHDPIFWHSWHFKSNEFQPPGSTQFGAATWPRLKHGTANVTPSLCRVLFATKKFTSKPCWSI